MNEQKTKRKRLAISTLLSSTILASGAQADDVEVYVTPPSAPVAPNVLFILDESGSMAWSSPRRIDQLKQAMTTVLNDNNNDNINAAILAYTTRSHPTRVVHDFDLIKNERANMVAAVNSLRPLAGTPSIHALASGVQWYDTGFRGMASPIANNPAGNWCKPNYIVFLSDGSPNSNHYETDLDANTLVISTNPDTYRNTVCATDNNAGGIYNPYDGNGNGGSCANEIGTWAFNTDLRSGGEWDWDPKDLIKDPANKRIQNVIIHTIGMAMGDSTPPASNRERFMKYVAQQGGGQYFPAGNAAQLTTAFQKILNEAKASIPYTYTAPTIPFDKNNAAISGTDIYVPVFKPGVHSLWYGNIKKFKISYELSNPLDQNSPKIIVIRDKNGNAALDPNFLFLDAVDKWNSTGIGDNGEPLEGGATSNMAGARNLYTWLGGNTDLTDASNRVEKNNAALDASILGDLAANNDLNDLGNDFDDRKEKLLDWLTWAADVMLPDGNGGNVAVSHKNEMGAPLHTQPVVVRKGGDEIVFITTTEGILHAFDGATGEEKWSFMPADLLDTVADAFISDWNAAKPHDPQTGEPIPPNDHGHVTLPQYGLDGPLMSYEHQGKTYLLMGMRRGGRNYYVLDITNPLQPEFAWKIEGGTGKFKRLGQTWSKPIFTKLELNGNNAREVLIFGGGYDTGQDQSYIDNNNDGVFNAGDVPIARKADTLGNIIYIVDPGQGTWIAEIKDSDMVQGDMDNAIASDILPVDINANGITDRLYAAGVGGRIIRVDIPDKALTKLTQNPNLSATVVVDVNIDANGNDQPGSDFQRFFNTPEVAYFNKGGLQYLALMIASGHRPEPLSKSVANDRFYMIKDPNVWKAPPDGNDADSDPDYPPVLKEGPYDPNNPQPNLLYDATDNFIQDGNAQQKAAAQAALSASNGWYINLDPGEKGFSQAKVYDYAVMFTTYSGTRSPSIDACDALTTQGESKFYALDMKDGSAIFDLHGTGSLSAVNRKRLLKIPGMPPAPSLLFPKAVNAQGNVKLGGEVLALVGLQEVTRWPDRFHPVSWEEVIDD